ncbi:MAG: DUF3800 domain-containing protein [Xanthomonadales bacterium]|nr:DUF3800 domain-containing protein [Xanthomonadales bacterium]
MIINQYSDYIVYVDESGDHGLATIDENHPVFVLAFCIVNKSIYTHQISPVLQEFKFRHFGHDQIILHEAAIRKDKGSFSFLKSRELKETFQCELSEIILATPFTLVATVIMKTTYKARYLSPANPYHVALGYGLERVFYYLCEMNAVSAPTHIIFEKRGKKEDAELELEFRRVCAGGNFKEHRLPFEIIFADKKSNSSGLQLAGLLARPVGIKALRPNKPNRAFDVIEKKFYRDERSRYLGRGLKVFP